MQKHWLNSFAYLSSQIINVVIPLIIYRYLFTSSSSLQNFAGLAVSITVVSALKQIVDWGFTTRGIALLNKGWLKQYKPIDQLYTIYSARLVIASLVVLVYLFFAKNVWELLFIFLSVMNPNIFIHNLLLSRWINVANILEKFLFLGLIFYYINNQIYEFYFIFLFIAQLSSYLFLNFIIIYRLKSLRSNNVNTKHAITSQFPYMIQNTGNIIYSNCLVPLLSAFSSSGVTLSYFGAEKIIKAVQIISNSCVVAVGPMMQNVDSVSFKKILTTLVILLGVIPMIIICLNTQLIWNTVYGNNIQTINMNVIRIISISLVSSMLFSITTNYFFDVKAGIVSTIIFGTALLALLFFVISDLSYWYLIWTVFLVELSLLFFGFFSLINGTKIR